MRQALAKAFGSVFIFSSLNAESKGFGGARKHDKASDVRS
jgi:hypothetical protein